MEKTTIILFLISLFFQPIQAQVSADSELMRSTISSLGTSEEINTNNHNYVVQQSIGQASVIGTFYSFDFVLRQGFIQPLTNSTTDQSFIREIENSWVSLDVNVYPNPFSSYLSLEFNEIVSGKIKVEISDISGQLVFTKEYEALQFITVQPQILSGAQYILKVTANNTHFIQKILKD